jgi:hypothetical protein
VISATPNRTRPAIGTGQVQAYGFKGAPPARRARAQPAQSDRELKPRSAEEERVVECERDHLVLSGEWEGSHRARGVD